MPKCEQCGKKGLFLTLSPRNTCEECSRSRKNFISLIREGFRVYDAYVQHVGPFQGGDYPAKFSVLSKKPLNKKSMMRMHVDDYLGVVKNIHAKDCRYITFNGKDIYEYDSVTGNTKSVEYFHFDRNFTHYYTTAE